MRATGRKAGEPGGKGPRIERRRIRTVIVDDSPFIVESLEGFFREQDGFEVVGVAETGVEGVERVAELQPDLVVMDVRMPGMDGLEATRRIKEGKERPVVIILTLEDSAAARAAAKAAGADDFVSKMAKMFDELEATIRRAFPDAKVGG